MQAWRRLDDGNNITQAGYRAIEHKEFQMNSGRTMVADIANLGGDQAVVVVGVTHDQQIVIARQFRCGPEKIMDELPGGMIDPGETPEQAGRRELHEEAGYEAGDMEYLGMAYVNAWSNTVHHFFWAEGCYESDKIPNPDLDEEVEVATISVRQLLENARSGGMTDGIAVLFAYDKLKALEGIQKL